MQIQLLFFGIISDITLERSKNSEISEGITVGELKEQLLIEYPKLKKHNNFLVAVNMEYANDTIEIKNSDTVALIPPVSGG